MIRCQSQQTLKLSDCQFWLGHYLRWLTSIRLRPLLLDVVLGVSHFSSRYRNWSIFLRFSSVSQIETRSMWLFGWHPYFELLFISSLIKIVSNAVFGESLAIFAQSKKCLHNGQTRQFLLFYRQLILRCVVHLRNQIYRNRINITKIWSFPLKYC